ncbi:MAG TPA: shikimate dehydrogenase [Ignavibacteriaceae bacterium]|nr:shikimate dehydrogenase [Ignavibacteriaceae bacterium]
MKNLTHSDTKLLALIGHPIKHSYSPFIQNTALKFKDLDYIYLPFDVTKSNLKNAIKGMTVLGIRGFNVTIPHKENILELLQTVSEEASIIGAVNTVVNDHGELNGYNTDSYGVTQTLLPYKKDISGQVVSLIGAGGAARAVIFSLIRNFKPKKINLINRTEQKAESLGNYFKDKMKFDSFTTLELFPPDLVETFRESKLIINATSIGMFPDNEDTVTDLKNSFNKNQIVFDVVYNPARTNLLKMAEKEGAVTLDGLTMLVHQASKSYELWTGEEMALEQVKNTLKYYIEN